MTIPARTIAQLARLSLSDDQAEIVAGMLRDVEDATKAEVGAVLEGRRAADRKRKQDERERAKLAEERAAHVTSRDTIENGHVTSQDVTGHPRTSADSDQSGAGTGFSKQELVPPSPPKGGTSPQKKRPPKPVGTLCPEDLRPSESHYLKCEQRGAPRDLADTAAEKTINWSLANAHRDIAYKSDWPRALHKVLDGEIEKYRANGGTARPPPGSNRGNGLNHLAERKAQGDASVYADPYAAYEQPSGRHNGRAHHDRREEPDFDFAEGDPEGRRGQLLDFGRARAGSG